MKNIQESLKTVMAATQNEQVIFPPQLLTKLQGKSAWDRLHHQFLVEARSGEAKYMHFLVHLAKLTDAKLIVELGNRYGLSTIALYHGMKADQRLVTIDTVKDQRYVPAEIFKDPRVTFVYGDCMQFRAMQDANIEVPVDIDILWSDTIHYNEQVSSEYYVYEPLLADESIIVIDDVGVNDKGKFFAQVKFWKKDYRDLHGSGYGIIHYKRPQSERGKTKQQRVDEALLRSSEVFERRWHKNYDKLSDVKARYKELKREELRETIKGIIGKRLMAFINKMRFSYTQ